MIPPAIIDEVLRKFVTWCDNPHFSFEVLQNRIAHQNQIDSPTGCTHIILSIDMDEGFTGDLVASYNKYGIVLSITWIFENTGLCVFERNDH